jgi:MFS family permease
VIGVYAYHHGGATAVGLILFARMAAAAVASPFTAALADRHPQRRVMLTADLVRVVTVGATAVAAWQGAPALVYVLAVATTAISTAFRPAEATLSTQLAQTPDELAAANVATSSFDSVGSFAGPAAGALTLAVAGPAFAFAVIAGAYAWSALFVAGIRAPAQPPVAEHEHEESGGLAGGIRAVSAEPRLRLLIGLYGAQALVAGAYNVLVVLVALKLLALGNAGVGYLETATGVGAVLGAAVALALVARRRLAGDFGIGLACFGAPLVAVALLPHTWGALAALLVLGIGNSMVDISATTLIQRTAPTAALGRVFGLVQGVIVAALGLGSVATPVLVDALGLRGALVAAGVVLPALAIVTHRALVTVDAGAIVPEEQLQAIAAVPFLDALPLQKKEALAAALERVELPAGATLFTEGQPGDQLYILTAGELEIDLPDGVKVERAPAFVGEIALLRDVPRTATVRTRAASILWALDGDRFVPLVTGHARSRSSADAVVASRGIAFGL